MPTSTAQDQRPQQDREDRDRQLPSDPQDDRQDASRDCTPFDQIIEPVGNAADDAASATATDENINTHGSER